MIRNPERRKRKAVQAATRVIAKHKSTKQFNRFLSQLNPPKVVREVE